MFLSTLRKYSTSHILRDVMHGVNPKTDVGSHGFVRLVDTMPRLVPQNTTADFAIAQAARVSYGNGTEKVHKDEGLIRYLMRNRHTSPLEMVEFKFHCKLPIFVARQWIRHRTANLNEYSGRYSVMKNEFYRPSEISYQSTQNNQGSEGVIKDEALIEEFERYLDKAESLHQDYNRLVEKGVSRETARIGLPVSEYTEWYWKIDLHNLFHFLNLRMDSHAQSEIQEFANAIFATIKPIVPQSCRAFEDYTLNSVTINGPEIEAMRLQDDTKIKNKRAIDEWMRKKIILGLK